MLIRLTAEQIAKLWPQIRQALTETIPPMAGEADDKMYRTLMALLVGQLQAWILVSKKKPLGLCVTGFLEDGYVGVKNLLIYSAYGYGEIGRDSWLEALVTLKDFGRGNDCRMLMAYSNIPSVVKMFQKLGGNAEYILLTIKLEE